MMGKGCWEADGSKGELMLNYFKYFIESCFLIAQKAGLRVPQQCASGVTQEQNTDDPTVTGQKNANKKISHNWFIKADQRTYRIIKILYGNIFEKQDMFDFAGHSGSLFYINISRGHESACFLRLHNKDGLDDFANFYEVSFQVAPRNVSPRLVLDTLNRVKEDLSSSNINGFLWFGTAADNAALINHCLKKQGFHVLGPLKPNPKFNRLEIRLGRALGGDNNPEQVMEMYERFVEAQRRFQPQKELLEAERRLQGIKIAFGDAAYQRAIACYVKTAAEVGHQAALDERIMEISLRSVYGNAKGA